MNGIFPVWRMSLDAYLVFRYACRLIIKGLLIYFAISSEIMKYSSISILMEPRLPPSVRHQLIDSQAENLRIQSALTF